jgi:hypothetical protein
MADFDVQGKITFDSTQAQAALKQTASAADQTATATAKVGQSAQAAQPQIGQFGSALGLAGQAVSKLNPALGGIVSTAGAATGAIQSLTTIGLGPAGIALGVISVAVTAGSALWGVYADEQKKAAESMKLNIIPTLDDLISKAQQAQRSLALTSRTQMGVGSATEQAQSVEQARLYVEQVNQKIRNLERTGPTGTSAFGMVNELDRLTQRQRLEALQAERTRAESVLDYRRQLQRQAAEEQQAIDQEMIEAFREEMAERERQLRDRNRGGGGGGGRRAAAEEPATTPMGYDSESAQRELARLEEDMATEADVRRMMRDLDIQEQNAAKDRSIEIAKALNEERDRLQKEAMDAEERLANERAAKLEEIDNAVFSALESAFSSSVSAWLDGSKSISQATRDMVRDVARSLTGEAIVQGLKETALGIGALAMGSPSAAIHFAAAGKWAAIGVAAGAVGAASGAFGGGGGGGGAPAAATGGPALTPGASEGAGTTVVINWGSSGLVYAADRAQLGRDIAGMIGEANGRLGRGM